MLLQLLGQGLPTYAILLFLAGFIFSITFHEFAHAVSAHWLGDQTPKYQGRLTINPLAHLDPIGTIAMFIAPFGWGKPVEVNPYNMGAYPERKYLITSLAGPISNVILAIIFYLISFLFIIFVQNGNIGINLQDSLDLYSIFKTLVTINIVLAIFNLIPVPPLDGSKIWAVILPYDSRVKFETLMERNMLVFMLILILFAGTIITPIVLYLTNFAYLPLKEIELAVFGLR